MARYCIELDESSLRAVIHDQHCDCYTHGSLLGMGRVDDIGEHGTIRGALKSIRRVFPEVALCNECCRHTQAAPG